MSTSKKDESTLPQKGEKTVKMRFSKDMFYNDTTIPLYVKGKIYDVPVRMQDRWIKRGGQILTAEEAAPKPAPTKPVEPPKAPVDPKTGKGDTEK